VPTGRLNERWQFGYVVSCEMYQLKALEIMKEIGIQHFNVSPGWLHKFLKWKDFCGRWKTSITQMLPNMYEKSLHFKSTGTVVCSSDDDKIISDSSDSNSEAYQ
jgi:hypothetical protein